MSGSGKEIGLADGLARLRAATGKAERRVVTTTCSKDEKSFSVVYERMDMRTSFKIASIKKGAASALVTVGKSATSEKPTSFSIADFDQTGLYCPCCMNEGATVFCHGCSTLYCGYGRTTDNRFYCPRCKTYGILSPAESIPGDASAISTQSNAKQIGSTPRKLLK